MMIVFIVSGLVLLACAGYVVFFTDGDVKTIGNPHIHAFDSEHFKPRYDVFDVPEKTVVDIENKRTAPPSIVDVITGTLPNNSFGSVPSTMASDVVEEAIELLAASVVVSDVDKDSSSYLSDILPSVVSVGKASPITTGSEVSIGIVHSI